MKKTILALSIIFASIACEQKAKKSTADINKDIKQMVDKTPGINAGSGSFSIEAIDGWEKLDTTFAGMETTILRSQPEGNNDNFIENITVVTQEANGYDAKQYFDENINQMQAQMPGFEKGENNEVNINGLKGYHIIYAHSYTGTPMDADAYFFVKNNIGYVVTGTTPKGKLNQWKPTFEKMINTFKVN